MDLALPRLKTQSLIASLGARALESVRLQGTKEKSLSFHLEGKFAALMDELESL